MMAERTTANPAVIIGLGGTGKWVLTYIKKSLLDTYGGEMPKTVRLLSFDTTIEKVSQDGVAQEEDIRVGDVQLDKQSEFLYLGGNIYQLCREIRDENKYPHIGSWLQASTYLQTYDSDAFDISRGAGQKRPFGRMSIFYDLQKDVTSTIVNKIKTAISEVIGANMRQQPVEIYIIASVAGGTGSGMFIDMAHLARWLATSQIQTGFAVRGFLALHNTFDAVIQTSQIQPQSFAALRELDRFMLVFDQQYPIWYNPSIPELRTTYGGKYGKLFDNCYLLDATRENYPLVKYPPQYGVFPSIADCITMLLDSRTGDAYAQHYKNVNTRIGEGQKKINQPIYSSLGTYSMILPVEDIITSLTYQFAIDLLGSYLLNLELRPDDSGQEQYVLRYDGNIAAEATSLLRSTQSISGVANTNFIQVVPEKVEKASTNDITYFNEVADMDAAELLTWVLPPESDPTVEEVTRQIRKDLEVLLINEVLPSSEAGDDTIEGCNRILRQVKKFREDYLGRDSGGRRVGGSYRIALEKCVNIHRTRYRTLLLEALDNEVNGTAPQNPAYQKERYGKLGKVQALLANLMLRFSDFSAFIERVQRVRAEWDELRGAQEEASLQRSNMEEAKGRVGFVGRFGFKDMQPAVKAQRVYLDAEQALIDVEVKDLFFEFLKRTSDGLREDTEEFKNSVDVWVATLAKGFAGERTDPGLYRYLRSGATNHKANREDKKRIAVHEYVTDDKYESSIYHSLADERFPEAMARLVWKFELQNEKVSLTLSSFYRSESVPRGGKSATERNAEHMLHLSRAYFEPLRESLNIADRLTEQDAMRVATTMLDKCSPLIRFDSLKTGGLQEMNYFVCVDEGNQKEYFQEFRDAMRRLGRNARENQVLDSSSSYACTILATADAIPSVGLQTYQMAEQAYNNHTGDARLLHIFPAEVQAVELEQQLPKIREPRRRFSHVLTTMLEDRKLVDMFIKGYLYRFIASESAPQMNSLYTLVLPNERRREVSRFELTRAVSQPSLFHAMETFVFRQADINNKTQRIDFTLLEEQLRSYEDGVSEGDDSRLINLLEQLIDDNIEPLRQSDNTQERDMGSLMRLVVDNFIAGLHTRIKTSGQRYNPDAEPLPVASVRGGQPQPAPQPSVQNDADREPVTPESDDGGPIPAPSSQKSYKEQLKELKEMLADDLLTQEEYDEMRKDIVARMKEG
jgi:Mg2+ and Co2+ transporter CorA